MIEFLGLVVRSALSVLFDIALWEWLKKRRRPA